MVIKPIAKLFVVKTQGKKLSEKGCPYGKTIC